jgi:hypothetical protein
MADLYTHKNIWIPFELKFYDKEDIDCKKLYSDESLSVDLELYQKNKYEKKYF